MIQLYSQGFDAVAGSPPTLGLRTLTVALELPVSLLLALAFMVPYHDFGHARVARSQNGDSSFRFSF